MQIPDVTRPQMTELGPPLGKAKDIETDNAVHEFKIANARPSILRKEKFRSSTGVCPKAISWASS